MGMKQQMTSASQRRIPARYFVLLFNALRVQGVDAARLLSIAGIDETAFNRRDNTLSMTEVNVFVRVAHELTGRDDLGFELGRLVKMNSHDLLGYGLLSCHTAHEAMCMASRHHHLMIETFALHYQRRPGSPGEATYTPTIAMPEATLRFLLEALAIALQNQVRLMLGADLPAFDIYLSMPEPAHVQRYRALAPIRFHFCENALPGVRVVMGAELLDRPLPMGNAQVVQQVDEQCSLLGTRPATGHFGWGEYVEMVLRAAEGEHVTLEDLARRLNVSARTIDRHLKSEDLAFRDLSDKVRFERACELLRTPGVTIRQVALKLGFSDTGNFRRAFRRVVGVSPTEYLNSNGQSFAA
ncbi:helix-turn-helix domain-containing protein [Paraburkholderia sp. 1N]|uniref:Helix-turn-helix domain-containing protein n=2 Tax=Paraburkholderia solitsugae TaxID=2675748 RepID=A0ABX2C4D1_9BURK|nr:helix-turn-helix domain-containing protein [Paraburkholderia solitsugae]